MKAKSKLPVTRDVPLKEPPVGPEVQGTALHKFPGSAMLAARNASVVAYSPDRPVLVSAGGGEGTLDRLTDRLQIWDPETGAVQSYLGLDRVQPKAIAWVGTPAWMVAAEVGPMAGIWDLATGRQVGQINAGASIYEIACARTNRLCATADGDGQVALWDLQPFEQTDGVNLLGNPRQLWKADEAVFALAMTEDGSTLYVPNLRGGRATLVWFDTASGKRQGSIDLEGEVRSLLLYPEQRKIAVGCTTPQGEAVVIHELAGGKPLARMYGHTHHIYGLKRLADGRLLSTSGDGTVRVWSTTGQPLKTLDFGSALWSLDVSADGSEFAAAGNSRSIPVWRTSTLEPKFNGSGRHVERIEGIAWTPDGRELITIDGSGKLLIRDQATGKIRVSHRQDEAFDSLRIQQGGDEFLTVDAANVRRWDLQTGKPKAQFATNRFAEYWYAPTGYLLRGDSTRVVTEVDAHTGVIRRTFGQSQQHDEIRQNLLRATSVTTSADGKWMAMARWDQPVQIYDLTTGALVRELPGTLEAAFRPDGKRLAVGFGRVSKRGNDLSLTIYDTETWHAVGSVTAEPGGMQYTPDGRLLATFESGGVALWDPETGERVSMVREPTHQVSAFAFDRTGTTLATGGLDGSIVTWDVSMVGRENEPGY